MNATEKIIEGFKINSKADIIYNKNLKHGKLPISFEDIEEKVDEVIP